MASKRDSMERALLITYENLTRVRLEVEAILADIKKQLKALEGSE